MQAKQILLLLFFMSEGDDVRRSVEGAVVGSYVGHLHDVLIEGVAVHLGDEGAVDLLVAAAERSDDGVLVLHLCEGVVADLSVGVELLDQVVDQVIPSIACGCG